MANSNSDLRDRRASTPDVDSEVYILAAKSLNALYPNLEISPVVLGKYFNLLQLPARRLIRAGILSREDLDKTMHEKESSESEIVFVSAETSSPAIPPDAEDSVEPELGPIGLMLQANGISMSPRQLARLMSVLLTPPRFFVKRGLMAEDAFTTMHSNNVLEELMFFRQFHRESNHKSRNHKKSKVMHLPHPDKAGHKQVHVHFHVAPEDGHHTKRELSHGRHHGSFRAGRGHHGPDGRTHGPHLRHHEHLKDRPHHENHAGPHCRCPKPTV
jgi:hypothetical protein